MFPYKKTIIKNGGGNIKVSQNGLNLIKEFEGCRLTAYKPVPWEEMYTIGWGYYGVTEGTTWTQSQADSQLENDINNKYAPMVDAYVKGKANQNEFDALVSLAYNCGNVFVADGWAEFSHAYCASMIPKYRNAGGQVLQGLVRRRQAELDLFNKQVSSNSNQNIETKGEIKMYLIKGLDKAGKQKHWYVSDGVSVRHVRTIRMLENYQNKRAKLNLPVDTMFIEEIEKEFGKKIDINSGEFK
ncbi:endolysin [Lactococcus phage 37203]|uniref:Endolysin n=1 Tax=Lactococcus phage 37203 TaxID=2024335 RepID=A0A2Z2RXL2_9CAUD|nr:endolysin [Lactococcus phage 37203]ASZ70771.1 lysin [Lactococcus phage 37203]